MQLSQLRVFFLGSVIRVLRPNGSALRKRLFVHNLATSIPLVQHLSSKFSQGSLHLLPRGRLAAQQTADDQSPQPFPVRAAFLATIWVPMAVISSQQNTMLS